MEYLCSDQSRTDGLNGFNLIKEEVKKAAQAIEDSNTGIYFNTRFEPDFFYQLGFKGLNLKIHRMKVYSNTSFPKTKLTIIIFFQDQSEGTAGQERDLYSQEYYFDRSFSRVQGCTCFESENNYLSTNQLCDYWIKKYITELENDPGQKRFLPVI